MGAPTLRSPTDGRASGDVLVSGVEREPWTPSPRLQAAAALGALLAASLVVTAGLVRAQRAEDARELAVRAAERALRLELRTGAALVRRDRGSDAPGRPAVARVLVEVVNTGTQTVRVVSAAPTPGSWRAEVVGRDVAPPGQAVVVALHRGVDCSGRAAPGLAPEQLVLTALLPDQTPRSVGVDVAHEQPAYGGALDDVLRDPGRACSALPGPRSALDP